MMNEPHEGANTMKSKHISAKDTNKMIRQALKRSFPGHKFRVRLSGGSTDIAWIDGPTTEEVEAVAKPFGSATFDSMTDCRGVRSQLALNEDGDFERVYYGVAFVFCKREVSDEVAEEIAAEVRREVPEFNTRDMFHIRWCWDGDGFVTDAQHALNGMQVIRQKHEMTSYAPVKKASK
jgi:hypothetical protein